jgi:hypothetical protein
VISARESKGIFAGSLQSAAGVDASFRTKSGKPQSGYALEISEACAKDNDVQFIADYSVDPNRTPDADILEARIGAIKSTGCNELNLDGGFYGGDVIDAAAAAGVSLHFGDMTGTEPKKGISAKDFKFDPATGLINLCPSGFEPLRAGECRTQFTAHFNKDACSGCSFKGQCQ